MNEELARAGDADVESVIIAWAKAGVLDSAAQNAIAASHEQGNAVTIIEDWMVYRFMPDGSNVELRRLPRRPKSRYRRGTFRIGK